MRLRLAALAALVVALALALSACGGGDDPIDRVRERAERVRERAEQARDRLRRRVEQVLDDIRKAVPEARPGTAPPATRGRTEQTTVEGFLTDVLQSVDGYWTQTLRAAGRPEPRVGYLWVPPGTAVRTACGAPAGDDAAFYCPNDDTIYVGQQLAAELWQGIAGNFPGERAGYGHAVGDFGLAYVIAHEYAHNIQEELGLFTVGQRAGVEPFELQADCMAGLWGNSVYREGRLQPGDVEEALSTATAAGDFDVNNPQHHGTPAERREAWLRGYRSGDPSVCSAYVPA
jgi:uncharacterized protein